MYFLLHMREKVIFPLPIHRKAKKGPPYFYLRFIWPTDPESVPHVEPPRWSFPPSLSWYVYPSPSYSVVGADTLRDLLTLTLTFDLLTLDSGQTWLVTWSTPPPSWNILRLSVLDLWVMMSAIYRPPLTMCLEPLRMRRITWPVRTANFSKIFEIPDPDLSVYYATSTALRSR